MTGRRKRHQMGGARVCVHCVTWEFCRRTGAWCWRRRDLRLLWRRGARLRWKDTWKRCVRGDPPPDPLLIICSPQEEENLLVASEELGGAVDAVPAGLPGMPSATVITPPEGEAALCRFGPTQRPELDCGPSPGQSRSSTPSTLTSDPATCPIIPGCETTIHISKGRTGLGLSIVGGCDTLLVRTLPPPPHHQRRLGWRVLMMSHGPRGRGAGWRVLMMSHSLPHPPLLHLFPPGGGGSFVRPRSQQTISSLGM